MDRINERFKKYLQVVADNQAVDNSIWELNDEDLPILLTLSKFRYMLENVDPNELPQLRLEGGKIYKLGDL